MIRSRLGRFAAVPVLLVAAFVPNLPSHAAAPVPWPVFVTIEITGQGATQTPQYKVTSIAQGVQVSDPVGEIVDVTADWTCQSVFVPGTSFRVECQPDAPPKPIVFSEGPTGLTVHRTWACDEPQVQAHIQGLVQNEYVTGSVWCDQAVPASCTATASTLTLQGYQGNCVSAAPPAPVPIGCESVLTGVVYDEWSVTCYGTDP